MTNPEREKAGRYECGAERRSADPPVDHGVWDGRAIQPQAQNVQETALEMMGEETERAPSQWHVHEPRGNVKEDSGPSL